VRRLPREPPRHGGGRQRLRSGHQQHPRHAVHGQPRRSRLGQALRRLPYRGDGRRRASSEHRPVAGRGASRGAAPPVAPGPDGPTGTRDRVRRPDSSFWYSNTIGWPVCGRDPCCIAARSWAKWYRPFCRRPS